MTLYSDLFDLNHNFSKKI